MKQLPKEAGGAKRKNGGDRRSKAARDQSGSRTGLKPGETRDDAAKALGVGTNEARALEKVFFTDGVPQELKDAVNKKQLAPTPVAKAIATEQKRQGGSISDPSALKTLAMPRRPASECPRRSSASGAMRRAPFHKWRRPRAGTEHARGRARREGQRACL